MKSWELNTQRLVYLREIRGLTQEQLSAIAGYSVRTVRRAESGSAVSWKLTRDLAQSLGVHSYELLKEADVEQISESSRDVANRFSSSLVQNDFQSISVMLEETVQLQWPGPKILPYTGIHRGKDAVLHALVERYESVRFLRHPSYKCVVASCDHAVITGTEAFYGFEDGSPREIDTCLILQLEGLKISLLHLYADHSLLLLQHASEQT